MCARSCARPFGPGRPGPASFREPPTVKVGNPSMRYRLWILGTALLVGAAACNSDQAGPAPPPACAASPPPVQTLAVGAYASVDPIADSGCVAIAAASPVAGDSAEYLVIVQSADGSPGATLGFDFRNLSASSGAAFGAVAAQRTAAERRTEIPRRFDATLREIGRTGRYPIAAAMAAGPAAPAPARAAAAKPVVGDMRTFKVCGDLNCSALKSATAVARSVGQHVAIYVDTATSGTGIGLTSAGLDSMETLFDTRLYGIDTTNFGREPDLDGNGVVIVLMTPIVNQLVTKTQCDTAGFVTGFFYAGDIAPGYATQFNDGEILYTVVPDSAGTLSCAHSRHQVETLLPPVMLHELEHLINFNQHVLVHQGQPETVWLDEALAKLAEELGGRSFLPTDSVSFSSYAINDVYDAYLYLDDPGGHALAAPSDQNLADVGAGWLFLRYLADQYGADVSRKLVQTSLTGTGNLEAATGQSFTTLIERWALANWVSDLPGFTPAPELTYHLWHFRRTYASLNRQDPADFARVFPLVPAVADTGAIQVGGSLHAGSGYYIRAVRLQDADPWYLRLTADGTNGLKQGAAAQVTVLRIR